LVAPERVSRLLLVDAACQPAAVAAGRYDAVSQPTWLAWAAEDPIVPLTSGQALAVALPNCELVVFEGHTHWPHHLHPDEFNEIAVTFLTRKLETGG
jgi:pimeloyl-ACP methyl ester carboxylesterase